MFIDYARIHVQAGRGGHGCMSFRREKNVPRGGPDGGHGGNGGNVVVRVDARKRTLIDFRYQQIYRAENGGAGQGKGMHGKTAPDLVILLPPGTVVRDAQTGQIVADLVEAGQSVIVAHGGTGGRGNSAFATSTNRAPRRAESGAPGEARVLELELKLLADVGLVGHPNAGKSTLLARLSDARPKIADYPFTTLEPHLGIVRIDEDDSFVMADIPGLIEGAHDGKGLGIQFLRHIERTRVLLFLLDITRPDPSDDYRVLQEELRLFNPTLVTRPSLVAFTKVDVLPDRSSLTALAARWDSPPLPISAVTGEGLPELLRQIHRVLHEVGQGVSV
ncbi:MAG: GTPase ObgE [Candidatus Latescibacteria bacterium]|nr:GTPase ObgE [Candidatus Latescibacterota bacterium]